MCIRDSIKPVQKQTRAGQRTRFKAVVVVGDSNGHVGLGIKTAKEVAGAIRAGIIIAKLSVIPIRRGYWGTNSVSYTHLDVYKRQVWMFRLSPVSCPLPLTGPS